MYLDNLRAHGMKSKLAVILKECHPLECCCLISCYYLVSSVNQLEVEKMTHKCHITWCLTNLSVVYLSWVSHCIIKILEWNLSKDANFEFFEFFELWVLVSYPEPNVFFEKVVQSGPTHCGVAVWVWNLSFCYIYILCYYESSWLVFQ